MNSMMYTRKMAITLKDILDIMEKDPLKELSMYLIIKL